MITKSNCRNHTRYDTWYAFKKEAESTLMCHIDNPLWLKIKPKKALPWHGADMQVALARLLKY
jgi:hypothetical protein